MERKFGQFHSLIPISKSSNERSSKLYPKSRAGAGYRHLYCTHFVRAGIIITGYRMVECGCETFDSGHTGMKGKCPKQDYEYKVHDS